MALVGPGDSFPANRTLTLGATRAPYVLFGSQDSGPDERDHVLPRREPRMALGTRSGPRLACGREGLCEAIPLRARPPTPGGGRRGRCAARCAARTPRSCGTGSIACWVPDRRARCAGPAAPGRRRPLPPRLGSGPRRAWGATAGEDERGSSLEQRSQARREGEARPRRPLASLASRRRRRGRWSFGVEDQRGVTPGRERHPSRGPRLEDELKGVLVARVADGGDLRLAVSGSVAPVPPVPPVIARKNDSEMVGSPCKVIWPLAATGCQRSGVGPSAGRC